MDRGKTSRANLSPRRAKVPGADRRGRNHAAIERTIAALRRADRLQELDAATLAIVRTTAAALDTAAGAYDVAVVARVHLAAVGALLAGHAVAPDDELDRFLASLRAPEVRDSPNS